jgi:hypothetical protein
MQAKQLLPLNRSYNHLKQTDIEATVRTLKTDDSMVYTSLAKAKESSNLPGSIQ